MGRRSWQKAIGRVRLWLTAPQADKIEQLRHDVQDLQRQVQDPARLRPLVAAALREELATVPPAVLAALVPAVRECLREGAAGETVRSSHRIWSGLMAVVGLVLVGSAGTGWAPQDVGVTAARAVSRAPQVPPAPSALAVNLQEDDAGTFGLNPSKKTDAALSRLVRARLQGCAALAGAHIRFAVKDGWVWLRGETTAAGRAAAAAALRDVGTGVLVVNQLRIAPAPQTLAQR
jgi:BON domain